MKQQIINKSKTFNKLIKINIKSDRTKVYFLLLIWAFLTVLTGCGSTNMTKIDDNTFNQMESDVAAIANSAVADAAPLELKFIKEKLQLARDAKNNRKRTVEAQLTEQIYASIKIARLRADLNQKNNQLLDKRDQVSAAQMYLMELQERLK